MNLNHILSALSFFQIQAEVLSAAKRMELVVKLRERLGVDVTVHAPWDDQAAPQGQLRLDGWELIPQYVGDTVCFVFLDGAATIWEFKCGSDLFKVLKECPPLEFYVCDQDVSYLLCSNHHDVITGWGSANKWVSSLGS